ncbi:hypothetical protein [Amycolatopsis alba]|uniref:Uncharacterized protein n=1 Tax=Amycolatopsis alba DSM 44262 TaxID=1125972 RepID=A0A229R9A7_AMYAL|nr:hypothetical protein [Amycolatopsis alba]OXM43069.1 hypothetical protein CFP75_40210 [Amycolatopsis alba DSM 44262]
MMSTHADGPTRAAGSRRGRFGRAAVAVMVVAGGVTGVVVSAPAAHAAGSRIFDRPGSTRFVVPEGVTRLTVQVWGGGGAGGEGTPGSGSFNSGPFSNTGGRGGDGGSGGGGGGYTTCTLTGVRPGQSFEVYVGAGGRSEFDPDGLVGDVLHVVGDVIKEAENDLVRGVGGSFLAEVVVPSLPVSREGLPSALIGLGVVHDSVVGALGGSEGQEGSFTGSPGGTGGDGVCRSGGDVSSSDFTSVSGGTGGTGGSGGPGTSGPFNLRGGTGGAGGNGGTGHDGVGGGGSGAGGGGGTPSGRAGRTGTVSDGGARGADGDPGESNHSGIGGTLGGKGSPGRVTLTW